MANLESRIFLVSRADPLLVSQFILSLRDSVVATKFSVANDLLS